MKDFAKLVLTLSLFVPAAVGLAAEPQTPLPVAPSSQTRSAPVAAHLGVEVGPLPPALAVQLPASVPRGQGVLIGRVEPGSSADAAGLRPYDLLLSYDDQRLLVPEQLSRLVALDRPGREVALKLVRGGEVFSVQAILGQAPMTPFMEHPRRTWPFGFFHPMQWAPTGQRQEVISESFESLNVEKHEDGRYRVSMEYLDRDGTKRRFELEGTSEEIRRQIGETKDMPPMARRRLLNAIDDNEAFPMPHLWGPLHFNDLMRAWRDGEWMQY